MQSFENVNNVILENKQRVNKLKSQIHNKSQVNSSILNKK